MNILQKQIIFMEKKTRNTIIRSRCKLFEQGEKNTQKIIWLEMKNTDFVMVISQLFFFLSQIIFFSPYNFVSLIFLDKIKIR